MFDLYLNLRLGQIFLFKLQCGRAGVFDLYPNLRLFKLQCGGLGYMICV